MGDHKEQARLALVAALGVDRPGSDTLKTYALELSDEAVKIIEAALRRADTEAREACARIVENAEILTHWNDDGSESDDARRTLESAAEAIRGTK